MNWRTIVFGELLQRKNKLITSMLAITLGIAVIVAIDNISTYSEKAIAQQLDALGTNILVLPKSASLENYYKADLQDESIPEDYVTLLTTSDLQGLDNLSPKLSTTVDINKHQVTLTGILPKNEFQSKAAWGGAGIFSRPQGCGNVKDIFGLTSATPKSPIGRKRVIETLESHDTLLGAGVASALALAEGDQFDILGDRFNVTAVLPETGTVDDSRIFAHLHTVQKLTGQGSVINAIEVVGCCDEISKGLVSKINSLLPDAKVVTVAQIVNTQIQTNQIMRNLSTLFLVIIVFVGGATIANDMYGNVFERRKEIGTLLALGASSWTIVRMFLFKAVVLGIAGGLAGFVLGTVMAIILGPIIADVPVIPIPMLLLAATALSMSIALIASLLPAYHASRLDPCIALQEI